MTKIIIIQHMQALINTIVELKELWGCISNTKLSNRPVLHFCQRERDRLQQSMWNVSLHLCQRSWMPEMSHRQRETGKESYESVLSKENRTSIIMETFSRWKYKIRLFLQGSCFCYSAGQDDFSDVPQHVCAVLGQRKQISQGEGLAETVIKSRSVLTE